VECLLAYAVDVLANAVLCGWWQHAACTSLALAPVSTVRDPVGHLQLVRAVMCVCACVVCDCRRCGHRREGLCGAPFSLYIWSGVCFGVGGDVGDEQANAVFPPDIVWQLPGLQGNPILAFPGLDGDIILAAGTDYMCWRLVNHAAVCGQCLRGCL
jgi:hypothetical protein